MKGEYDSKEWRRPFLVARKLYRHSDSCKTDLTPLRDVLPIPLKLKSLGSDFDGFEIDHHSDLMIRKPG